MEGGPGGASNAETKDPTAQPEQQHEPAAAGEEEVDLAKQRQEEREKARSEYLAAHPELELIVKFFLSEVLAKKPSDVGAFARDFFTQREAIEQYIRNHSKSS